jgi:predicted glycoside hydrolase/deacetylase ChbG (UPF0249 family)
MLIFTADDLALSDSVDRGILMAHRDGVVRSTSLLVTFPRAEVAAEMARAEPDLEVGLHIDLVEGRPVTDPAKIPSLVDEEGRFVGLNALLAGLATRRIRAEEVAAEVRAQVARARDLGTPALAWDTHRHVHLFPLVARVLGGLARELGARWIRRTAPPRFPAGPKQTALGAGAAASALFLRGIPGNDWYVDLASEPLSRDAAWVALLAAHGGVGEVSAHPAIAGEKDDPLAALRPRDLALVTDPLVRTVLQGVVRWRVV